MMPGETAFTRMPRAPYSTASDLVAEARPPLVSDVRTEGEAELAWSARVVVMFTTWPPPPGNITPMTRWVSQKNPVRFTPTTVA